MSYLTQPMNPLLDEFTTLLEGGERFIVGCLAYLLVDVEQRMIEDRL